MLAVVAMLAITAGADVITVNNHSFEDPTLGDGGWSASITGWNRGGQAGTLNPTSANIDESTVDGDNVVYQNGGGWMCQDTGVNFVEGNIYTLTVAVARCLTDAGFVSWDITLCKTDWTIAASLVGEIDVGDPENGALTDKVLEYTATADFAGSEIRILLRPDENNPPDTGQLHLDNVRLEFVPEPATIVLLGIGGIGVLIRRKRR